MIMTYHTVPNNIYVNVGGYDYRHVMCDEGINGNPTSREPCQHIKRTLLGKERE